MRSIPIGALKLDRVYKERRIIRELIVAGFPLLNSLGSYSYQTADRDEDSHFIRRFCDMALGVPGGKAPIGCHGGHRMVS